MSFLTGLFDRIFGGKHQELPVETNVNSSADNVEDEPVIIDDLRIDSYDAEWAEDFRTVIERLKLSGEVGMAHRDELVKLYEFSGQRLPVEVLWFFRYCNIPKGRRIYIGDVAFLGIDDLLRENLGAVPGCCVMPLGFMVIASTSIGDALCIDLEHECEDEIDEVDEDFTPSLPVYQIPHELVGEDGVRTMSEVLPLTRENVLEMAFEVGLDFSDFMLVMALDEPQLLGADTLVRQYEYRKKQRGNV